MEMKRKISKLLLIAIIIAPVLWIGYMTTAIIDTNIHAEGAYYRYKNNFKLYLEETDIDKDALIDIDKDVFIRECIKIETEQIIKITGVALLVLAMPTLLTVIGDRKNKRKMILTAGIVYIFTLFGIPSAVLCFIANAKMKKLE